MSKTVDRAIWHLENNDLSYIKYLSSNDVGLTSSHQRGIHIGHQGAPLLFEDGPGVKGENKSRFINVRWNGFETTRSRFIYYGAKTRNEYRLTNFGKGFPFLRPENVGSLFVITKEGPEDYFASVITEKSDIAEFLGHFGYTPIDMYSLLVRVQPTEENPLEREAIDRFLDGESESFPRFEAIANAAVSIVRETMPREKNPDKLLSEFIRVDLSIFNAAQMRASKSIKESGGVSDDAIKSFNAMMVSRRKERASAVLYRHVQSILDYFGIDYRPGRDNDYLLGNGYRVYAKSDISSVKDLPERRKRQRTFLITDKPGLRNDVLEAAIDSYIEVVVPDKLMSTFTPTAKKKLMNVSSFLSKVFAKQN